MLSTAVDRIKPGSNRLYSFKYTIALSVFPCSFATSPNISHALEFDLSYFKALLHLVIKVGKEFFPLNGTNVKLGYLNRANL